MIANWGQYLFLSSMGSSFAIITGAFTKMFIDNNSKMSEKESDKMIQQAWVILR
jgi:hypothetical protein